MTFVPFDPKKHKGVKLFESVCKRTGNKIGFHFRPSDASLRQAKKTPWYYFVKGESVEKATDIAKLLKRQAKDDNLGPPLEDDDPFWEVDDAYQEELAARVEAGVSGE